jgi:hypothetical protein
MLRKGSQMMKKSEPRNARIARSRRFFARGTDIGTEVMPQ